MRTWIRVAATALLLAAFIAPQGTSARGGGRPAPAHIAPHLVGPTQSTHPTGDVATHTPGHAGFVGDTAGFTAGNSEFKRQEVRDWLELTPRVAQQDVETRKVSSAYSCCSFVRTRANASQRYRDYENYLTQEYFNRQFDVGEARFLVQPIDRASIDLRDSLPMLKRRSLSPSLDSETKLDAAIAQMAKDGETSLYVIGHREEDKVFFNVERSPEVFDTWTMSFAALQALGAKHHIHVTVWACNSAEFASGGIAEAFNLRPFLQGVDKGLTGNKTNLEFLQEIVDAHTHEQLTIQFDAAELLVSAGDSMVSTVLHGPDSREKSQFELPFSSGSGLGAYAAQQAAFNAAVQNNLPVIDFSGTPSSGTSASDFVGFLIGVFIVVGAVVSFFGPSAGSETGSQDDRKKNRHEWVEETASLLKGAAADDEPTPIDARAIQQSQLLMRCIQAGPRLALAEYESSRNDAKWLDLDHAIAARMQANLARTVPDFRQKQTGYSQPKPG